MPRPVTLRSNVECPRRSQAVAGLQITKILPAVERSERMISRPPQRVPTGSRQAKHRLAAIPNDVSHPPGIKLAVFAERVNQEAAAVLEQVQHGGSLTRFRMDNRRLADNALIKSITCELDNQIPKVFRL